jgi:lipoprotein-releasing system ATP-binding protein
MTNSPVLEAKQLNKYYEDSSGQTQVLDHLDLTVVPGETVAIMGASGCGKSTLLHCLAGLDSFQSGEVQLLGDAIAQLSETQLCALRARAVGFIYQFHHLLPEFNALENVMMPMWLQNQSTSVAKEKAYHVLEQVGLQTHAKQQVQSLSGGERQRVAIARAMVTNPKILFADEPTGNLDEASAEAVMTLLLDLNKAMNCSLVMVTHDKSLAAHLDTQYQLRHGRLV